MKWRIYCPFCGASYKVESEVFGKKCRCAKCKQVFSVKARNPAEVVPAAEPQDADRDHQDDSRVVICPNCLKEIAWNNDFCPHCGYGLRNVPRAEGKPFLCGVLNIIGGFAVGLSGLAFIIQLVAAGVEFFYPSEDSYIREEFEEFYKSFLIECSVFFGGMVVLGISQAVARASRRW